MADKSWLSRWFGRTPTQSGTSAQSNESRMTAPSPSTSPPTSNDHRQMLRDILPDHGSPVSSPPQTTNFRSFDPSALNNGHSQKESLFVNTDSLTRKRQFTSSPDSLLVSERIKRFRDNIASTKDDEDHVPAFEASVVKPRMEHSFAGPYTQRNASMLESPGGSSSISLFSRRSTAPSTHSNISSKTRAILEQLERVTTPQTEAKRVPIFRPASTVPEVWNTSWHAGTNSTISIANSTSNPQNPPPRKRQPIPTSNRIQILTSALTTHYKKPYWRDIYRPKKPVEDKSSTSFQSPAIQRVQATSSSVVKVSPLFDLSDHPSPVTSSAKESGSATVSSVKAIPPLKGFDGKKVPNTFNAGCIYMEDSDGEQEKDSADVFIKRLDLPKVAPPKGFINDCLFDFEAPVERGPQANVSSSSDESSPESESSNSSDDIELVQNEVQTKVAEKSPVAPAIKIVTETLAPPTDSETSASVVATPNSSKNASPESLNKTPTTATVSKWYCSVCMLENQAAFTKCIACEAPKPGETTTASSATSKWTCSVCWVENQATSAKCVACESPKPGETAAAAAASTSTFKPTTFAPLALPKGVSFGFGGSKAPEAPLANKDDNAEVKRPLFGAGAGLGFGLSASGALKPALAPSAQTNGAILPFINGASGFGGAPSIDSTSTLGLPKSTPFGLSATTAPTTFLKFGGIGSDTVSKGLNDGAASSTPAPFTLGGNTASAPMTNSFTFNGASSIPSIPVFGNAQKTSDVVPETDKTQRKDTDKPFAPIKVFGETTVSLTDTKTPASIFAAPSLSKNSLLENLNQTPTTTKLGETATASTSTFKPTPMAPSNGVSIGFGGSKAPEAPSKSNDGAPDMKRPLFGPGPTTTPSFNFGPSEGAKLTLAPLAQPAQTPFIFGSNGFGGALSSASAPTLGLPHTTTSGSFSLGVPTAPPFNFSENAPDAVPTNFRFGDPASTGPFVFGGNAAPAPTFSFGDSQPSHSHFSLPPIAQVPSFGNAPPTDSPFAFNSSSTATGVGQEKDIFFKKHIQERRMGTPWKVASTIILWSRTTQRVLMLRRGATAPFMPSLHVFPGGVIDTVDSKLGQPERVAALRELFEETGLVPTIDGKIETAALNKDLANLQQRAQKDPSAFVEVSKLVGSALPLRSLQPWATWLTPNYGKKRYMTSFFLLPIEGEPEVNICTREMSSAVWLEPAKALPLAQDGALDLPPPQIYELTRLSQVSANSVTMPNNKTVICPQQLTGKPSGFIAFIYPGDRLYQETEDAYLIEPRVVDDLELAQGDPNASLHRCVFPARPSTKGLQLHFQNVPEKYGFHPFNVPLSQDAAAKKGKL
ncbi:unnamed protein product, partial [Mesorhabditis belari]|uniref:Nuclear pore complex protein Nup153 n=1 Tax=Mesorhabditis belari TaxID=2138241 RepID=A0AAF3FE13_9BILA